MFEVPVVVKEKGGQEWEVTEFTSDEAVVAKCKASLKAAVHVCYWCMKALDLHGSCEDWDRLMGRKCLPKIEIVSNAEATRQRWAEWLRGTVYSASSHRRCKSGSSLRILASTDFCKHQEDWAVSTR